MSGRVIPPDGVSGEAWARALDAYFEAWDRAGDGHEGRWLGLAAAAPHLLAETRTENERLRLHLEAFIAVTAGGPTNTSVAPNAHIWRVRQEAMVAIKGESWLHDVYEKALAERDRLVGVVEEAAREAFGLLDEIGSYGWTKAWRVLRDALAALDREPNRA